MHRGGVFLGRAGCWLERGLCVCVRARLFARFRDLIHVRKEGLGVKFKRPNL